jgi:hypothetical protein
MRERGPVGCDVRAGEESEHGICGGHDVLVYYALGEGLRVLMLASACTVRLGVVRTYGLIHLEMLSI